MVIRSYLTISKNGFERARLQPPRRAEKLLDRVELAFRACPEYPWACGPPKEMKNLNGVSLSEERSDESKDPFVAQSCPMFFDRAESKGRRLIRLFMFITRGL